MNVFKTIGGRPPTSKQLGWPGAVSRLMQTFQQGAMTLQRLRSGGRQIVRCSTSMSAQADRLLLPDRYPEGAAFPIRPGRWQKW